MERLPRHDLVLEKTEQSEKPFKRYSKKALKYSRMAILGGLIISTLVKDQEKIFLDESFEEMVARAKIEMASNGITNEQRQAYTPIVNDLLQRGIQPFAYTNNEWFNVGEYSIPLDRIKEIIPNIIFGKNKSNAINVKAREDAWRLYLGLPQQNNTFGISDHVPENSHELKYYFKINEFWKTLNRNGPDQELIKNIINNKVKQPLSTSYDPYVMGNYYLALGEDKKGTYISYYDNWNLDMIPIEKGGFFGKPFKLYDRLYYNPETFEPVLPSSEQHKKSDK